MWCYTLASMDQMVVPFLSHTRPDKVGVMHLHTHVSSIIILSCWSNWRTKYLANWRFPKIFFYRLCYSANMYKMNLYSHLVVEIDTNRYLIFRSIRDLICSVWIVIYLIGFDLICKYTNIWCLDKNKSDLILINTIKLEKLKKKNPAII